MLIPRTEMKMLDMEIVAQSVIVPGPVVLPSLSLVHVYASLQFRSHGMHGGLNVRVHSRQLVLQFARPVNLSWSGRNGSVRHAKDGHQRAVNVGSSLTGNLVPVAF